MAQNKETSVGVKLVADLRNYQKGLKEGSKNTRSFQKDVKAGFDDVKGSITALAQGDIRALPGLFKAAGSGAGVMGKGIKGINAALVSTGIGALIVGLGVAIGALTSYFKNTEEGQIAFKKVMNNIAAVIEPFKALVNSLGKALFDAFKNPGETLKKLGEAFKNNFVNRFVGAKELFISLGKVGAASFDLIKAKIKNVWSDQTENIDNAKKELGEAAKEMGIAATKMSTGIDLENTKIFKGTADAIKQNMSQVQDLNKAEEDLIKTKRANLLENKKLEAEINEARRIANDEDNYSVTERARAIDSAIEKQKQLAANKRTELDLETQIAETKASFGDNDIETNDKLTQLKAQQFEIISEQERAIKRMGEDQQRINRELQNELDIRQQIIDERNRQRQAPAPVQMETIQTTVQNAKPDDSLQGMADATEKASARAKAALEDYNQELEKTQAMAQAVGDGVGTAMEQMGMQIIDSLDLADTGFQGFVKTMAPLIIKMISMLTANAISNAISGASQAGTATGPLAPFTTPAFIATSVATVLTAFSKIPKFAYGGIVPGNSFAGDRVPVMANSGELILNKAQQNNVAGQLGTGNQRVHVTVDNISITGDMIRIALKQSERNTNQFTGE